MVLAFFEFIAMISLCILCHALLVCGLHTHTNATIAAIISPAPATHARAAEVITGANS